MLADEDCEDGPPEVTFNDVRRGKYMYNIGNLFGLYCLCCNYRVYI